MNNANSTDNDLTDKPRNSLHQPEECLLKPGDKKSRLDEKERYFADGGYLWRPYKCQYDLMNTDKRHSCLKEKNVTNFLDFGDRCDVKALVLYSMNPFGT